MGMAVYLKDIWYSAIIEYGYVSSRMLQPQFKFVRVKVCVVLVHVPTDEAEEERDKFWSDLGRIMEGVVGTNYVP